MLTKFKSSNVSKIFCGHYHRNAGGWDGPSLELVVTSAIGCQIGNDPHGMRIVKVFEDHIEHKYHSLEDCPTDIEFKTQLYRYDVDVGEFVHFNKNFHTEITTIEQ